MAKIKKEKTALEIRIRLVREVAARKIQAEKHLEEERVITKKLEDLEKGYKDFLEKLGTKLRIRIPTDELNVEIMNEVKVEHDKFFENYKEDKEDLLRKIAYNEEKGRDLFREAHRQFALLLEEIRSWQFGRGELIFTNQGINRVFGIIKEFGESYHCSGYFFYRENYVSRDDIRKIAEACENNQGPLIHISDIKFMPINQEEAETLCGSIVDYEVIKKMIPKEMIPWKPPFVYLLKKDSAREPYMIPLNENYVVVLDVYDGGFPHRKVRIVGKLRRDEDVLKGLFHAHAKELEDVIKKITLKERKIALKSFSEFYDRKYPGMIINVE